MRNNDKYQSSYKLKVEVSNGNIEKALKDFKRKTIESGHLQELKDNKEYTKPKTKRRKQKLDAIRKEKIRVFREKYYE